jgi:hypothetical protein
MTKEFKLSIDLIPSTVWFSSIRNILYERGQRAKWQHVKDEIFQKEGRQCWICGTQDGVLEAHEFWEYDDKQHIQKLISIHHLCAICHMVKHIGFSCQTDVGMSKMARLGLTRDDLILHFCKINKCEKIDFAIYETNTFALWKQRSKYEWTQDFGNYI